MSELLFCVTDPDIRDIGPLWHLRRLGFVTDQEWWSRVSRVWSPFCTMTELCTTINWTETPDPRPQ